MRRYRSSSHYTRTRPASGLRLRYAAWGFIALAGLYGGVSFLAGDNPPPVENKTVLAAADVPVQFVNEKTPAAHHNLKAAFDAAPPQPGYDYNVPAADMAAIAKEMNKIEPGGGAVEKALQENIQLPVRKMAQTASLSIGKALQGLLPDAETPLGTGRKVKVARGDTLMDLLVKNHVPRPEAYQAIEALRKVYDPRRLNPGHEVTVFFNRDPAIADPQFRGISIEKDVVNMVHVLREVDGAYIVQEKERPVRTGLKTYSGTIDNSLYLAADEAGMPDNVIIDLIRMYSWSVDFQRDIQRGDEFQVMYKEVTTDDGRPVPGRMEIVVAQLTLSGTEMPFYLFTDSKGDTDYFDDNGKSAKKTLMKTPIDGARLSSGFGKRKHPILGYQKMHKGLDFAAPRGTPIYAAGDGTIEKRGRNGGYGNYIRIRHRNNLKTAYAHLKGYKSGLNIGSRVKQGQVIGYVGSTGRSTGPHLHYEVLQGGRQINPRTLKLPTGRTLKGSALAKFKSQVKRMDEMYAALSEAPVQVAAR